MQFKRQIRVIGKAGAARWALVVGLAIVIGWIQPIRPVVFVGSSMDPTYPHLSLAWSVPFDGKAMPGDVVVVQTETGKVVKRVAFIEGDVVPRYVRGLEHVDVVGTDVQDLARAGWRDVPFRVPPGMVYLLGDNPIASKDSRHLGGFPVANIERIVVNAKPFHGEHRAAYASVPGGSGVL